MWFQAFANLVLRFLYWLLLDVYVQGVENVPAQGALIVAISHTSYLDPVLATAYVTREMRLMGKEELFEGAISGRIVKWYGAFPVRRGTVDRSAVKNALRVLRSGGALLIAPEGTRSQDGTLMPGRSGVSLLALRTGAQILPVGIWGGEIFGDNLKRFRKTRINLCIGHPFSVETPDGKLSREQLDEVTQEIMYRIAELLPSERRGVYSDLSAATTNHLVLEEARSGRRWAQHNRQSGI